MMQAVGSAKLVYLAWLVGGLLSFFGALTYAELGAMKPQAGGEYVYVRDAYGPLGGFLYAWTWFVIAKPASMATIATGLVRILGTFSIFSFFSHQRYLRSFRRHLGPACGHRRGHSYFSSELPRSQEGWRIPARVHGAESGNHSRHRGGLLQRAGSATGRGWSNFASTFTGAKGGIAGFMAALVAALWAYDGWNDLNMVAGEVKQPERNIPIALIAGVATVGVLYVLVNAGVQYVLPASAIAASPRPASDAVALVMGHMGASIVSAGMAISMLVTLNGTIMSGARVPFAVARDGYFFSALAEVHPRFHTPVGRYHGAGGLVDRSPASGRQFPPALFARHFRGMALLHDRGQYRLRFPLARSPGGAALIACSAIPFVPALFITVAAVLLLLHLPGELAEFFVWIAGNSGWRTGFLLVSQATSSADAMPILTASRAPSPFWAEFPRDCLLGYLRSRAVDTFTPCPFSRKCENSSPGPLPRPGSPWSPYMAMYQRGFQLGILPERKIDRRAWSTSYAFMVVSFSPGQSWTDISGPVAAQDSIASRN